MSSNNIFKKKISLLYFFVLLYGINLEAIPKRVIILRHGEKESECGNLSPRGVERSFALARYFQNNSAILLCQTPKACFACEGRTIQTITPTAESFFQSSNIPFQHVNVYYALPDVQRERLVAVTHKVSYEILQNSIYNNKVLIVCWEHRNIPRLAHLLGALDAPDHWPDDSFDMFWIITYGCKSINFEMQPQNLLPGDINAINLKTKLPGAVEGKYCP